jgi:hypothetical protein
VTGEGVDAARGTLDAMLAGRPPRQASQ